jgi:hypothetical protein
MQPLIFRFGPDVPLERQELVLKQIETWPEVVKTGRVLSSADNLEQKLDCFAYIKDQVHLNSIADRLAHLPEIHSSSVPPVRRLIF